MADANSVLSGLVGVIGDAAGDKIDAAAKAKIALYTGVLGSALNVILPQIDGKIDWSALEASIATGLIGIDTAFKGVEAAIAQAQATGSVPNA